MSKLSSLIVALTRLVHLAEVHRAYLYRIATFIGTVAVGGGLIDGTREGYIVALIGLVLGVPNGVAAANTSTRPPAAVRRPGVPGLRPPVNRPALAAARILTGIVVAPPAFADALGRLKAWRMLGNDAAGDCVSVTWANFRRLVTALLAGREFYPTQAQVWALYRTQNPDFDPNGTADTNGPGSAADGGMDIQTLLEYLVKHGGPDGVKVVAFAKVDVTNFDELRAAAALFGLWLGVDVDRAQMQQFNTHQPWDYVAGSPSDGSHSILSAGEDGGDLKIITWAQETELTRAFCAHQLQQAWLVIWPEHLGTAALEQGVDMVTLAADYKALTGRDFPVVVTPPQPAPTPTPGPGIDAALAAALTRFLKGHSAPEYVRTAAAAWLASLPSTTRAGITVHLDGSQMKKTLRRLPRGPLPRRQSGE